MILFNFLAQFREDHFSYPVVSSFELFFLLVYCIRLDVSSLSPFNPTFAFIPKTYHYNRHTLLIVIHINVSRWFSSRVWVTTSLLKSPGTLLSILADFNNATVCMISIRPLISKSSSPCTDSLVNILSAPITICIIYFSCSVAFFLVL